VIFWRIWGYQRGGIWTVGDWAVVDLGFRRRFGAVGEFWRSVPGDLGCRRLSVALSAVSGGVPGDLGCRWSVVVSAIRFPAIPAIGAVVNLGFRTGASAGSGVAVLFWCAVNVDLGAWGLWLVGWTCNLWFGV
jgi:hypothetical protein